MNVCVTSFSGHDCTGDTSEVSAAVEGGFLEGGQSTVLQCPLLTAGKHFTFNAPPAPGKLHHQEKLFISS